MLSIVETVLGIEIIDRLFEEDESETNSRGERRRFPRRRFPRGRKDGSGKGVGQPGGLRRNRNTEPCTDGGPGEGQGGGQGQGKNRA